MKKMLRYKHSKFLQNDNIYEYLIFQQLKTTRLFAL